MTVPFEPSSFARTRKRIVESPTGVEVGCVGDWVLEVLEYKQEQAEDIRESCIEPVPQAVAYDGKLVVAEEGAVKVLQKALSGYFPSRMKARRQLSRLHGYPGGTVVSVVAAEVLVGEVVLVVELVIGGCCGTT